MLSSLSVNLLTFWTYVVIYCELGTSGRRHSKTWPKNPVANIEEETVLENDAPLRKGNLSRGEEGVDQTDWTVLDTQTTQALRLDRQTSCLHYWTGLPAMHQPQHHRESIVVTLLPRVRRPSWYESRGGNSN